MTEPEIDVRRLMDDIRAAVARREAEGRKSILDASLELREMLAKVSPGPDIGPAPGEPEPLHLQPEFAPSEDDHYHVDDLLKYHDHAFVWNAYRAVLKREPDEEGLRQFLDLLRSGRFNKIDVLARLRYSPEGRGRNVSVDGLSRPAFVRRLYRVPVVGYLMELAVSLARLPAIVRGQRQFEAHVLGQQERMAARINDLSHTGFQVAESYSRELSELSDYSTGVYARVGRVADLQMQQVAGLWREQREILKHMQALGEELDARLSQGEEAPKGGTLSASPKDMDGLLAAFSDEFRGTREEVKEGLKFYLPALRAAGVRGDVLDLGCGRGEWLELLRDEGIEARGVDSNAPATTASRALGLEVSEGDALAHLRSLPDGSLSAVTGFHFIEHLPFATLVEVIDEAARTLRPGGLLIFETPNPKNLVVGACNFYSDPTHLRPLFPETVQFVLGKRGFGDVRVEYLNAVEGCPFDDDDSERERALASWLYGPRDFAVIGRKA